MDLLSDILRELRLESAVMSMAELRAPWGLDKGRVEGAPFYAIIAGECWLDIEGQPSRHLATGDLVVVPLGHRHALRSQADASLTPFTDVLKANGIATPLPPGARLQQPNRLTFGGTGPLTRIVIGLFLFRDRRRNVLLEALPALIHVRGGAGDAHAPLASALKLLVDESFSGMPGFRTIAERVADVVFVQVVRYAITAEPSNGVGWVRGLSDPQIGRALSLAHSQPAEAWTVASLARAIGLSRTVFSRRFRALTGATVMEYVTERRMQRAAELLTDSQLGLSELANQVGYESEVSFSKAFRRWASIPPGRYRRSMTASGVAARVTSTK